MMAVTAHRSPDTWAWGLLMWNRLWSSMKAALWWNTKRAYLLYRWYSQAKATIIKQI